MSYNDTVQSKYSFGEGSPEGILNGKVGFTYEDVSNGDKYESLGGAKWRKVVHRNSPTTIRKVSNILNDKQELDKVSKGEVIFDEQKGIDLLCVIDSPLQYLKIESKMVGGVRNSTHLMANKEIAGSLTYDIGTVIRYKLNVKEHPMTATTYLVGFYAQGSALKILKNDLDTYNLTPFHNGVPPLFEVKDLDGKDLSPSKLKFNKWYDITVVLQEALTISTSTNSQNTRGLNLSYGVANGAVIYLADLEIRGEKFFIEERVSKDFEDNDITYKTFIGNLGSKFYHRPEPNILPTESGIVTKGTIFEDKVVGELGIYALRPPNGVVTPQMYGYVCSKFKDNTNDASDYIQACADSRFEVFIPGGFYYLEKSVIIRMAKTYTFVGNTDTITLGNNIIQVPDEGSNEYLSWIWTDQNINMFNIQCSRVNIKGGLTDSSDCLDYDKSHFRMDANYRVSYNRFEDLMGQGSLDTIHQPGKGGKLIFTDLEVEPMGQGNSYYNKIINCYGLYLMSVVAISDPSQEWLERPANFINTYEIEIKGDGCKKFLDLRAGNNFKVIASVQDRAVLPEEEQFFAPFYVYGNKAIIDVHCFDQNFGGSGENEEGYYRHSRAWLEAPNKENRLVGRSLNVHDIFREYKGVRGANHFGILNNPSKAYLSDSDGRVTSTNNTVRYAQDYNLVTYKGYIAPNLEWFNNNLYVADSDLNSSKAFDGGTKAVITNPTFLLTSLYTNAHPYHTLDHTEEFAFAEVSIILPSTDRVYRLAITMSASERGLSYKYIQVIQQLSDGTFITRMLNERNLSEGAYDLPIDTSPLTARLAIRFIGADRTADMRILDISVVQRNQIEPILNIGGTNQIKIGAISSYKGFGDNFAIDNNNTPIINFTESLIESESLRLSASNSHIALNNQSGTLKDISFFNSFATAGIEYFIRTTSSSVGTLYETSAPIRLVSDATPLYLKDGKSSITLKANEWIILKSVDAGRPDRKNRILVEIARSARISPNIQIQTITGTTYTLLPTDEKLRFTNSNGCTLYLPENPSLDTKVEVTNHCGVDKRLIIQPLNKETTSIYQDPFVVVTNGDSAKIEAVTATLYNITKGLESIEFATVVTSLTATPDSNSITLNWIDPTDTTNLVRIDIWRSNDGVNTEIESSVPLGQQTYTDLTASPGITYIYSIRSVSELDYYVEATVAVTITQ